jgi:hypothetical protein
VGFVKQPEPVPGPFLVFYVQTKKIQDHLNGGYSDGFKLIAANPPTMSSVISGEVTSMWTVIWDVRGPA